MRILAITSKHSGVGYHRIMMPIVNMKKDYAHITDILNDEVLEKGFDIVVINRMLNEISAEQLEAWRDKYGFKLIVDNDDHWQLDPHHLLADRYKQFGITEKIISYLRIANLCTVTHERLADEVKEYNSNVEILPNCLPYGKEQFECNKTESDLVRLFWSGSGTHEADINIIRNPFKRLQGVKTIMAGYNSNEKEVWDRMIVAFTNSLKLNPTIYNYAGVTQYMGAYSDSDIGIIPLLDSRFNAMKSNLKVLENATMKNPCIVSDVNPYKNLPVFYVKSQKDWVKHINNLVNDKDMREQSGKELFEYCNKHYNFDLVNEERFNIYSKCL
jgi:hypothetical protein